MPLLFLSSHEVEGESYLRADYAALCSGSTWAAFSVYSSIWVASFVIAFPVWMLWKLYSYRDSPLDSSHALGFLMDDFKPHVPALLWEGIEMLRKLLLSVVGSFWSTKATMSIATALLISAFFLAMHLHLNPYKSKTLGHLQSLALTVLTLFYYVGLLLKADSVDEADQENLGVLMVLLMMVIFVTAIMMLTLELKAVIQWSGSVWHAFSILYEGRIHEKKGVPCICSFPG
jgi:hypothetical protein